MRNGAIVGRIRSGDTKECNLQYVKVYVSESTEVGLLVTVCCDRRKIARSLLLFDLTVFIVYYSLSDRSALAVLLFLSQFRLHFYGDCLI